MQPLQSKPEHSLPVNSYSGLAIKSIASIEELWRSIGFSLGAIESQRNGDEYEGKLNKMEMGGGRGRLRRQRTPNDG